jgi:hypothetical protein
MVGDRGMLTKARIEETIKPAGLNFITTLRAHDPKPGFNGHPSIFALR